MSESRYTTRSDPDDTTRIPKEGLEGLRDADQAREGASSSSSSSPSKPANGSPGIARPPAGGFPSDGSAVPPGGSRPPLFGSGGIGGGGTGGSTAAANGSGFRSEHPPGPSLGGSGGSGSSAGSPPPAASSPIGYPERSQTGYSPAAYQRSYSSTVSGPGVPVPSTAAAGLGGAAAARSALGTAGRPSPTARGAVGSRPPRRARLLVRHIDPWSTLKFSFVLSVAMFFVWLVAVGVLYGVLDGMGVFEQINGLYGEVAGSGDRLFSPGLVLGSATVVGAVNIVLFTALATIGAFVYNICSDLVGGIEVTLAERD
jgi:hypothetical protein